MNLLLDTHVFLWQVTGDLRLGERQQGILNDPENTIFLSATSIFEMSIKICIGKLDVPERYIGNLVQIYVEFDFVPLNVSPRHANLAGQLTGAHRDPFDRLLAAQSIVENMSIMTVDEKIRDLGARVVW